MKEAENENYNPTGCQNRNDGGHSRQKRFEDFLYFGVAGLSWTPYRVDVFFAHYFGRPDHGVWYLTTMRFVG